MRCVAENRHGAEIICSTDSAGHCMQAYYGKTRVKASIEVH